LYYTIYLFPSNIITYFSILSKGNIPRLEPFAQDIYTNKMKDTLPAVALCATGAEKAVSNELRKMNLKVEESLYGRVRFHADTRGLYQALIGLRAADRVLLKPRVLTPPISTRCLKER